MLPFLYHKLAITCQIDSYKVSNSTLRPDLCNHVKIEVTESIAPPEQPHKRGSNFLATPCTLFGDFLFFIPLLSTGEVGSLV